MLESRHAKCKRILILANLDVGLYRFRKELIEALIADGHEVYISLPRGEYIEKLEALGCKFLDTPVDRRGVNPAVDIKLYMRYARMIKSLKPGLVITYTVKPNIYGASACRIHKIPYAVNITGLGSALEGGGILKKLILLLYRFSLKKAGTVFFENEGNRTALVSAGVVPEGRDIVMPGAGVNTDDFKPLPYPEGETVRFLFVGRIMREKGVDELLYAARKIKDKYGDRAEFDFVGFYEDEYKGRIEELVGDGVISFHGFQADVRAFYERAGCVVLPSWHEGMSNVILEAAACARPVITNNICGCREAVEDGVSGLLCVPRDRESLFSRLDEFAAFSRQRREEMGKRGRELVSNGFCKADVVRKTLERLNK